MEGVWRCSHVGRTTIWYYLTYKGNVVPIKGSFLTNCLPWFSAIKRTPGIPPGAFPGMPCIEGSLPDCQTVSVI